MEKIRIGVVGAGNISQSAHLPAYKSVENAEVVAIADINIERAKQAAEKFGIPAYYGSVEELLEKENVDAIDVCTWNCGHAPVAIAAANAGKHIICEKPMTVSVEKALEIKAAVDKAGVRFMLAVPGRFGNENIYIHDMLEKGELGEVYFAKTAYVRRRGTPLGWFTDLKTAGGGPVIDIGIHGIDAAWYLMGCPKPVRVSAATYSYIGDYQTKGVGRWHGTPSPDNQFDTEDSGNGIIHFENGAVLLFEASWAINAPDKCETLICGTKAGASLDPPTVYAERAGHLTTEQITVSRKNDRFQLEIDHFAKSVIDGTVSRYPIEQAVLMQRMLQAIYDSAASGKEILL